MKWLARIALVVFVSGAVAGGAWAEPRAFDRVTYTAPDGWKVEDSGRGFVQLIRAGAEGYCLVAIYPGVPAGADLAASFATAWTNVALRTVDPVAAPAPTIGDVGNTRAAMAATPAALKGTPVILTLLVLDAGPAAVPVIVLTSSPEAFGAFSGELKALLTSFVVTRDAGAAPDKPPEKLVIPPPDHQLGVEELAGEWRHQDRISTTYVYRSSGNYAGSDNLTYGDAWTITAKGAVTSNFYAIRNGKKIVEKTSGTLRIDGAVLDVSLGSHSRYVIRGWLEAPSMTVLLVCGPFYDADTAALEEHIANPGKGVNLEMTWVRHKK